MDSSINHGNYQSGGSGLSRLPWIPIGCGILLLSCISFICVAAFLNVGLGTLENEQSEVEVVIDRYMTDMANKENDNVAEMFVERINRAELQSQLEGMDYAYFEGYRAITVNNFRVAQQVNTNPMTPQGTVATLNGTVQYSRGFTGTFDAVLEKHDGKWLFFGINVNVSAEKIRATEEE